MEVHDEHIQFMTYKFKKKSNLRKFMEEEFQFYMSRRTFKLQTFRLQGNLVPNLEVHFKDQSSSANVEGRISFGNPESKVRKFKCERFQE